MSARSVERVVEEARGALAGLSNEEARWGAGAPGRVNLIGEHTDYNGGFVLPMAIERACVAVGTPSLGNAIRVVSAQCAGVVEIPLGSPVVACEGESGTFGAYVRGVVAGFARRGGPMRAIDIGVSSDVPLGSGLSSSAALETALATLLARVMGVKIAPVEVAALCRSAEHEFAGVPCGIMDQYISACGRVGHALLIDCRSGKAEEVRIPDSMRVVVFDTGVRHALASGEYAARRATCHEAARRLGLVDLRAGVDAVLSAGENVLGFVERNRTRLSGDEYRAARHVMGEIVRTVGGAAAVRAGNLEELGRLVNESHDSLRDDFRVSCEELDTIVEAARGVAGVFGARMTGAGFGGSAIAIAAPEVIPALMARVSHAFQLKFARACEGFTTGAAGGAGAIEGLTTESLRRRGGGEERGEEKRRQGGMNQGTGDG